MSIEPTDPKRQAIIQGATRIFLKHGFRRASMDKIAQAAPVSKATVYHHFENKDALFAAVILELCRSLLQTMAAATLDSLDVAKNLRRIAQSFVDLIFAEEALAIYRVVIAECRDFPELGRLVYDSAPQAALSQLENYLRALNEQERLSIPDVPVAADAFFSLLKGDLHFRCLLGVSPPPSPEQKHRLIDQVVAIYLRGVLDVRH